MYELFEVIAEGVFRAIGVVVEKSKRIRWRSWFEIFIGLLCLSSIPALISHVIVAMSDEEYMLLFTGLFFPPVGVIHGYGLWFGYF